jgi:hypothetical protein
MHLALRTMCSTALWAARMVMYTQPCWTWHRCVRVGGGGHLALTVQWLILALACLCILTSLDDESLDDETLGRYTLPGCWLHNPVGCTIFFLLLSIVQLCPYLIHHSGNIKTIDHHTNTNTNIYTRIHTHVRTHLHLHLQLLPYTCASSVGLPSEQHPGGPRLAHCAQACHGFSL